MNVRPDGILGAIVGSEGMGLTDTMVNGAGGCRSRAQIMLNELDPVYRGEVAGCCSSKYFGRQSRLPCTYVNGDDIVFGTSPKVSDGVSSVSGVTGRRVLLVDTLGVSLVCSDNSLSGAEPLELEGDLSSMTFDEGYDLAAEAVLRSSGISDDPRPGVNILGYGLPDPGWTYGMGEIRSLLSMMGVRVNAFVGCVDSLEAISSSGGSDLCVMVHPERCHRVASFYKELGIPSLRPSCGSPVGYRATKSFLAEIANRLGIDPSPAIEAVDRDEQAVRMMLMKSDRAADGLRARTFSVQGCSSTVLPLTRWMTDVFAMVPGAVRVEDEEYAPEISSYLDGMGFGRAFGAEDEGEIDVYFTDGLKASKGRLERDVPAYVEIGMPRGRALDLMGRCLVGRPGCRYILDEMLNGVTRFRCGQPKYADLRRCIRYSMDSLFRVKRPEQGRATVTLPWEEFQGRV